MNRSRQARWWLAFARRGNWRFSLCPFTAADSTNLPAHANAPGVPAILMPPAPSSPVTYFRQLLAMTPKERANSLTNRAPEARARILDKVREYQALAPDERELRLHATELRWYLTPLFKIAPADREASLAQVPGELRDLVKSRLAQWDALSPQSRRNFWTTSGRCIILAHEFENDAPVTGIQRGPTDAEQARSRRSPRTSGEKIADAFNQFFEFTPEETQRALNTLSTAEREQMEKTLEAFNKLPPAQRAQCIRAFTEFASMSPSDRAEFLKNAESWSKMPPKERQAWRILVAEVPTWPPLPPTLLMPPVPPPLPPNNPRPAPRTQPVVATNHL